MRVFIDTRETKIGLTLTYPVTQEDSEGLALFDLVIDENLPGSRLHLYVKDKTQGFTYKSDGTDMREGAEVTLTLKDRLGKGKDVIFFVTVVGKCYNIMVEW